jgi:hypothetical protein
MQKTKELIMNLVLLFILFQMCDSYVHRFTYKCLSPMKQWYKNKYTNFNFQIGNNINMKTCFAEEEDENNLSKKINDILVNKISIANTKHDFDKNLYTLVWYDCKECITLIEDIEKLNLKYIYVNGGSYFYEIDDDVNIFNTPLFYKDDMFIADNIFDIYTEIYK